MLELARKPSIPHNISALRTENDLIKMKNLDEELAMIDSQKRQGDGSPISRWATLAQKLSRTDPTSETT